uniref:CobW C-terminal domain-containing protein n=1 Tax=Hemiselmis tepida TaxID=464990 RepID=A0A7S0VMP5_9CRYP
MADPNEILVLAQKNDVTAIKKLLDSGVSASAANGVGQTALHVACLWGNIEAAEELIKAGAEVNVTNNFSGGTPLHCAATENDRGNKEGRKKCLEALVKAGADPEIRDFRAKKPAQYSTMDDVRALLGAGPYDPDAEGADDEDDGMIPDSQKTPVTIVTGFLGSGKTTLVNYILHERHGKKIAVIENEFGEVNIDSSLVTDNLQAKEDIISMDNGCVCCTVRGDLVKAFQTLGRRKEKYDAVIIETTGMADPAPVAFTFNSRPEVGMQFRIDSILCLVDAKHIKAHLDDVRESDVVNEAVQQVAFADKILLNKIDLVNEDEKKKVKRSLKSINATAKVIECQQSRVNLDELLGLGTFSLENVSHMMEELSDEEDAEEHGGHGHSHEDSHGHSHGHSHDHDHGDKDCDDTCTHPQKKPKRSAHLSGVSSVGVSFEGELDEKKFNMFMTNLLQTRANDLYRCKGVLKFKGNDDKFVFHGVHEQIEFGPSEVGWAQGEKIMVKMVFIGRKLDRAFLTDGITGCKAD